MLVSAKTESIATRTTGKETKTLLQANFCF